MNIYLATPCYGAIDPQVAHAIAIDVVPSLLRAGHAVRWDIEAGDPNQVRARSIIQARFVESGFDRIVWFDADTLPTGNDIIALVAIEEDMVGTLCTPRSLDGGWVGLPVEPKNIRGLLIEAQRIGSGMFSMSRECALKLSAAAPRTIVPQRGSGAGQRIPMVWETAIENERFISCDYELSRRWRALGGRIWLHSGVKVGHIGKHVFRGDE